MQREKVRVYVLARELNVESKDLLDMCRDAGFDVKNQLSSLDPEQRDAVELMLKRGTKGPATGGAPSAPSAAPPVLPTQIDNRVRVLAPQRRRDVPAEAAPAPVAPPAPPVSAPAVVSPPPPSPEVAPPVPEPVPEIKSPVAPAALIEPEAPAKKIAEPIKPVEPPKTAAPAAPTAPKPPDATPPPRPAPEVPQRMPDLSSGRVPTLSTGAGRVPTLGGQSRPDGGPGRMNRPPRPIRPPSGRLPGLAAPPPLKKLPTPPAQKRQEPISQKPIARPADLKPGTGTPKDPIPGPPKVGGTLAPGAAPEVFEDEDDDKKKGGAGVRPGHVPGREARHAKRSERQKQRKDRVESTLRATGSATTIIDRILDEVPTHRSQRRLKDLQKRKPGPQPRKEKIRLELPITVRSLSEATGLRVSDLMGRLIKLGAPLTTTVNSMIEQEMAELVAHDAGADIEIRKPIDIEDQIPDSKSDGPDDLVPRAPIVTIMGHVDHGKTTLLDKIRKSNVVATEAGGITQVIRAWRVEHNGKPITFLDTPGHEAFTKMRARGANVTDIAVIVVAADDGVMPQTEEAINHAKAAGVSMVVAINKVDLPNANLTKTRQQLYGLNVLPDNMGGDVPFVETSGASGKGIFNENGLLDMLSIVAELKELKANPKKPASGTCLEAMLSEGEGVLGTMLVREGTLRRGDVILCGSAYGRVRQMYNDQGEPIQEAGPSVPVRITGLDEVPNADDSFHVVPDLALAREIAERRKSRHQEAALTPRNLVTLEKLSQVKIAELKVILKADFRGSIEAIKKELEKLAHDEVRVNLLHSGIGGITESDVVLALTSPSDTLIVGFNVTPDDRALTMAEERGVEIREYDIIYKLTDDIRAALQGKLKPHEQVVHLGRAVVRKTFKIGRVGTVAGCYVTQGTFERTAKVRVIRGGVVIYPPPDRTASLESLKRVKDDAREVREGFECGMKILGYDDIKVDDVIEAYRIDQVQRTL